MNPPRCWMEYEATRSSSSSTSHQYLKRVSWELAVSHVLLILLSTAAKDMQRQVLDTACKRMNVHFSATATTRAGKKSSLEDEPALLALSKRAGVMMEKKFGPLPKTGFGSLCETGGKQGKYDSMSKMNPQLGTPQPAADSWALPAVSPRQASPDDVTRH